MKVNEIWDLVSWLKESFEETNVASRFDQLVTQHQQANGDGNKLNVVKEEMTDFLEEIPLRNFTANELAMLRRLKIDDIFNHNPLYYVDELYSANTYSANQKIQKLANTRSNLNDAKRVILETFNNLYKLVPPNSREHESANESSPILRLTFQKEAKIDDVVELKEWSENLHAIIRGIMMSQNLNPKDCKIVDTGKGSHWFELLVDPTTIQIFSDSVVAISKAIGAMLATATTFKGFQVAAKKADVKLLELEKVKQELESELEDKKNEVIEAELERLTKDYNLIKESQNELKKALRLIYELTEKGGVSEIKGGHLSEQTKAIESKLNQSLLELSEEKQRLELEYKVSPEDSNRAK